MRHILWILPVLLMSCSAPVQREKTSNSSKSMYTVMRTDNILHKLYTPAEVNEAPHPFYHDRKNDPIYPYPDACGFGSFLFDPETDELHYAISYSGLSGRPVMMHFHLGDDEQSGPIIQTIFGKPDGEVKGLGYSPAPPTSSKEAPEGRAGMVRGTYKLQGNSKLNPPLTKKEERELLMQGHIYVNIHTYLNENGEIRGQIFPCH